jgi:hypothetical protein
MMHDYSKRYETERDRWLENSIPNTVCAFLYGVVLTGLTGLYWYVATI